MTNKQAGRPTDRHVGRNAYKHTNRHKGRDTEI